LYLFIKTNYKKIVKIKALKFFILYFIAHVKLCVCKYSGSRLL
jgi:hypothetical protein